MATESDRYNYEAELDDESDGLQFGKFKGLTPVQVASTEKGRQWMVWAHRNAIQWIGSEELVRKVFHLEQQLYEPREKSRARTEQAPSVSVAEFEAAMLEAYGCFPKQIWQRW